ncbi:hypothetical protein [Flavivirga rizhaonensis]|uniref:Uncharacterized protein n=1 Tax=Flavivirga rizhaonensis TaxID=2559571 RepID=A0A4S1DT01_9FLAO|nr:hypothetical protein [Flavivirga rizhaonensis]TGV01097.1 hypothetical protein EM932_16595 [Flavivirga rizhaonensis]
MSHFFKILFIVVCLLGVLQSCSSEETTIETISREDRISSDLVTKIIKTTTSRNDYSLINFDCENVLIAGDFINSQGDAAEHTFNTSFWNDELMLDALKGIFSETQIRFTKDDFHIEIIADFGTNGPGILNTRDNVIDYFEDCSFEGNTTFFHPEPVTVSEINYNCSGNAKYFIGQNFFPDVYITEDAIPLNGGVDAVQEALSAYNLANNSTYSIEELKVSQVNFTSPEGTDSRAIGKEEIMNYFEDCMLDRDINDNDCINFKYPFVMNKINLQTDEIVPITINNDSELNQDFFGQFENVTFNYPLTLITLNGDEIVVTSNKDLEKALTNSADYCTNDDW